jgi:hypothetical protein
MLMISQFPPLQSSCILNIFALCLPIPQFSRGICQLPITKILKQWIVEIQIIKDLRIYSILSIVNEIVFAEDVECRAFRVDTLCEGVLVSEILGGLLIDLEL